MVTLGVDFSAKPARTALCWIRWEGNRAEVRDVAKRAGNEALLAAFTEVDKVGIDAPFGWPDAFVAAVMAHRSGGQWPNSADDPKRKALRFRRTDLAILTHTRQWPLSVSSQLIAIQAMRLASIFSTLQEKGEAVARDGSGKFVEVYPAAALKVWKFGNRGYKGKENAEARRKLFQDIRTSTSSWLTLPDRICQACLDSDDVLDALIAALVARASSAGLCEPIPSDDRELARHEGWIALPTFGSLNRLAIS